MAGTSQSGPRRWARAVLLVGFLGLAGGTSVALWNPATGYELSVYAATPPAFWVGVGVAAFAGLGVGWLAPTGTARTLGCVLGGAAVSAVMGLPLVRGYYFVGHADAMTHLGWAKDIASGVMRPAGILYPGIHTFAVFAAETLGVPVRRGIVLVVFVCGLVFFVLFPLVAQRITDRDRIGTLAAFSAFMLLPVNLLSTHLQPHSFTQTLLFSTLVLYALVVYLQSSGRDGRGVGVVLALSTTAVVVYHPQQAANLLAVFLAVALVQVLAGALGRRRAFRNLYGQTAWFGAAFTGWTALHYSFVDGPIGNLVGGLLGYLQGAPPDAGGAVTSQSQSLSAIGAGVVGVFLKLFLVSSVYLALAGLVVLVVALRRSERDFPDRFVGLFALGIVAVTPLPVAYFLGDVAEHYFRHLGFIMLVVSLLGALAVSEGRRRWRASVGPRLDGVYTWVVPVVLATLLVLSVVVFFPSPYIHKPNRHVTESELTGYEASLDRVPADAELAGVRGKLYRYYDGIYGTRGAPGNERSVSAANLTALDAYFDGDGYVVLSTYERRREVDAYEGLRYGRAEFRSLRAQPGVDRVLANRETTLYHAG